MSKKSYNIGQLAKQSGLSTVAIRFYEKKGLLPTVKRSANGYRCYDEDSLALLALIQNAKQAGFNLDGT